MTVYKIFLFQCQNNFYMYRIIFL